MKISKYILLLVLSIISFTRLSAQELDVSATEVSSEVTQSEKEAIIKVVKEKWKTYLSSSDLSNENDRDDYFSLFDFDAQHYVDYKESPVFAMKSIADYVENAESEMSSGLVFSVAEPTLVSIGVGDDFYFFAELKFIKSFNEYFDAKGDMKFRDAGLASEQTLRFSIDPEDMTQTFIASVRGIDVDGPAVVETETVLEPVETETVFELENTEKEEEQVVQVKEERKKSEADYVTYKEVESIFSATLGGSLGSGSLSRPDDILTRAILGEDPSSGMSYLGLPGLNLSFRRSIGSEQKMYLNFGLGVELGKLTVDISDFSHSVGSNGFEKEDIFINRSARSNSGDDIEPINGDREENSATIFIPESGSIEDGEESSSVYLMNFSGGVSYKLFESGSALTSLFFDLGADANYLAAAGSNNVTYSGDIIDGIKLPTDPLFPKEDVINGNYELIKDDNGEILGAYDASSDDISTTGGSGSNLFFGAHAGLTLQRKINYGFGFEISGRYQFGLTPLYSASSEDGEFLDGNINIPRNSNIIEQYYSNSKLNRLTVRLGLFFLLNQD